MEGKEIEDEYPIRGKAWTDCGRGQGILNRRSEHTLCFILGLSTLTWCFYSAIRFALNLRQHHGMPVSRAYSVSVAQFRSLRSEQEVATMIAALEAEYYGAEFGPMETERGFNKELEALKTWEVDERYDQQTIAARKGWKAVLSAVSLPFLGLLVRSMSGSGGKEFVRIILLR